MNDEDWIRINDQSTMNDEQSTRINDHWILQEKLFLATEKVVAKNLISLLKMIFATNSIVAGTAVAKAFSNDYGGCKRYLFFATSSIVAK